MTDIEKVAKGIDICLLQFHCGVDCPYYDDGCQERLREDALELLELLKEQRKQIKALRLLVEWAEECDFGFDQFQDEYERYKDEIKDMGYIDGMIHVAMRTLEDHGALET